MDARGLLLLALIGYAAAAPWRCYTTSDGSTVCIATTGNPSIAPPQISFARSPPPCSLSSTVYTPREFIQLSPFPQPNIRPCPDEQPYPCPQPTPCSEPCPSVQPTPCGAPYPCPQPIPCPEPYPCLQPTPCPEPFPCPQPMPCPQYF